MTTTQARDLFIDFCLRGLAQTWPFLIGWRVLGNFDDVKARVLVEMFGVHGDQVNMVEQHRHALISLVGALCGGRASKTCSKLILRSHKNLKLFFFQGKSSCHIDKKEMAMKCMGAQCKSIPYLLS